MAEAKPIPVRLSPEIIARLDKCAVKMGNTRTGVIKLCISSFLDHFEANGSVASLPLDWQAILDRLDGRTTESRVRYGKSPTKWPATSLNDAPLEPNVDMSDSTTTYRKKRRSKET